MQALIEAAKNLRNYVDISTIRPGKKVEAEWSKRAEAVDRALENVGWRPIDSCPKDGTIVVFGGPKMPKAIICRADDYWSGCAYWLEDATHWQPDLAMPS